MIALFTASLFAGCAFTPPDCADGYQRDTMGQCQAVELDTGGMVIAGEFTGSITIDVEAKVVEQTLTDVCEGELGIDVDDSVVVGTLFCNFSGPFDDVLAGQTFEGSLNGQIDNNSAVTGDLTLDLALFGVLDATWSGTGSSAQISGDFDGDMSVEFAGQVVPVTYSGSFQVAP